MIIQKNLKYLSIYTKNTEIPFEVATTTLLESEVIMLLVTIQKYENVYVRLHVQSDNQIKKLKTVLNHFVLFLLYPCKS